MGRLVRGGNDSSVAAFGRFALRDQALEDAVGVWVLDVEGDAELGQIRRQDIGQDVGREVRLLLVEVDGDDVEVDRRARAGS
jgi:hypothetical protein